MNWIELGQMLKDIGLATGAFGLCIYVVVQITGRLSRGLDKNIATLDNMIAKQDLFMSRVKKEHEIADEAHKQFALQNQAITEALGRINGWKA